MPERESTPARRVVLVVGAEPAATGTVATAFTVLGAGGLGDGRDGSWVRDLHGDLLDRCGVETDDARPTAWFETGKACANGITRARLTDWLGGQFIHAFGERAGEPRPELVVADPGLPWFLGLWRAAALRCEATVAQVIVLTPPPGPSATNGAEPVAEWINRMLHLERSTREDAHREFVSYADVARDWTVPFVALGRELRLRAVGEATANQIRRGHDVMAAGPAADEPRLDGLPGVVRDLAVEVWEALSGVTADAAVLDSLRGRYAELHSAAESIAGSSRRAGVRQVEATLPAPVASATVRGRTRHRIRRALGR